MEKIIKEISKEYNQSEKFVRLLFKICEDNNIFNKEEIVKEVCQKVCQSKRIALQNTAK